MLRLIAWVLLVGVTLASNKSAFNEKLGWLNLEEYEKLDLTKNDKPIFYQIYLEGCGACEALKKDINKDTPHASKVAELSQHFRMVLLEKKEIVGHKLVDSLSIDGQYFPRTYFAAPDGEVYADVKRDSAKHQFFVFTKEISELMQKALDKSADAKKAKEAADEAAGASSTEAAADKEPAKKGSTDAGKDAQAEAAKQAVHEDSASENQPKAKVDKSRGFNSKVNWISLDDALKIDLESNKKPFLVLQHMKGCQACKMLQKDFLDEELVGPALPVFDGFHMVNVDSSEDMPAKWLPKDSGYYPRVVFLNPQGKLMEAIKNKDIKQFPWYYPKVLQLQYAAERMIVLMSFDYDERMLGQLPFTRHSELYGDESEPSGEYGFMDEGMEFDSSEADEDDEYDDEAIDAAVAKKQAAKQAGEGAEVEL